jgi:hypothetical protein
MAASSLLGLCIVLGACRSGTEPAEYEWAGVYTTATKSGGATGTWNGHAPLEVTADRRVIQGTTEIQNPTLGANTLSWTTADGNATNATVTFMSESSATYYWSAPVSGKLFQGSIQSPGSGPVDYRGLVQ